MVPDGAEWTKAMCLADLDFWEEAKKRRPGYGALAARWGWWNPGKVRRLVDGWRVKEQGAQPTAVGGKRKPVSQCSDSVATGERQGRDRNTAPIYLNIQGPFAVYRQGSDRVATGSRHPLSLYTPRAFTSSPLHLFTRS